HERRVKRMRHHQPLPPITPLPQLPKTRLHRLLRTGHHRVLRPVHRRHAHSAPMTLHHLPHLTLRRKHRRHHSTRWQRPHEPTPRSNQPQPILQTEHPRHARRHILPHTVPQHHRRLHSPRTPQLAQRILQRKERRLRVLRAVEKIPSTPIEHLQERYLQLPTEQRIAAIQRIPEHRSALVQPTPHPHVLRSLTREEERHARRIPRRNLSGDHAGSFPTRRHRLERGLRLLYRLRHHRRPVPELRTPRVRRMRHIRKRELLLPLAQPLRIPARILPQRPLLTPTHHQHVHRPVHLASATLARLGCRRRSHYHVRVRAAEPERAHPRNPLRTLRPPLPLRHHPHRQTFPRDVRVRLPKMQMRRNLPIPHRKHRLHQPRNPCRRLQVPHVRLHGPDQNRPLL